MTSIDFNDIRLVWGIAGKSVGLPEADIDVFRRAAGGKLPLVLEEYYRKLGGHKNNCQQDRLLEVRFADKPWNRALHPEYFTFYVECQGVCEWAFRIEDATLENPPVWVYLDDSQWLVESPSLLDFLLTMAYYQVSWVWPYSSLQVDSAIRSITPKEMAVIREQIPLSCQPLKYWMNGQGLEIRGYNPGQAIILLSANDPTDYEMFYSAATAVQFAELEHALAGMGELI